MNSYRELHVWQEAMKLVSSIYDATRTFPSEERYGLVSQLRRAAVSIPSNIAEGKGRWTDKEFHRFLAIARGSLFEVETLVILSDKLSYFVSTDAETSLKTCGKVGRMLSSLMNSLDT